jgi:hypothetical protein
MAVVSHAIPDLDRKGLRSFGLTTGAIVAALFGVFFPWLLDLPIPWWPWIVGAVLVLWGLVAPSTLRMLYRTWMRFGLVMSRITTPIILGLMFFLVITPVGLARNMFGRSSMPRSFDAALQSYRKESVQQPAQKLEKPY